MSAKLDQQLNALRMIVMALAGGVLSLLVIVLVLGPQADLDAEGGEATGGVLLISLGGMALTAAPMFLAMAQNARMMSCLTALESMSRTICMSSFK